MEPPEIVIEDEDAILREEFGTPLESSTEKSFKKLLEKALHSIGSSDVNNKSAGPDGNICELDKAVIAPSTGCVTTTNKASKFLDLDFRKEFEEYDVIQETKEKKLKQDGRMVAESDWKLSLNNQQVLQIESRDTPAMSEHEESICASLCGLSPSLIKMKCSIF